MIDTDVYHRIIWSADGRTPEEVLRTVNQIGQPICIKLDRLFFRRYGKRANRTARVLRADGYDVFNDAKLIEIPSKLEELAQVEIELTEPWMLNAMAGSLSTGLANGATKEERDKVDGLKRFAEVCHAADVKSCAVTVLTSKSDDIVSYEFGERTPIDQVLHYVTYLQEFGFTDVVCSPREVAAIRSESQFDSLTLNTPGIRMPREDAGDQARTDTPGNAIRNGVNRVVIGRPISNAADPAAAIETIADDIRSALVAS